MTKIQEMVEWLEAKTLLDTYDADIAKIHLTEARRLAAEEAKEKPVEGLVERTIQYSDDKALSYLEPKPTAPASLVMKIKIMANKYGRARDMFIDDCHNILSCYRPTPTEDIVRELKDYLNNECPPIAWYSLTPEEKEYFKGVEAVQKRIGEIIRKYEEGK